MVEWDGAKRGEEKGNGREKMTMGGGEHHPWRSTEFLFVAVTVLSLLLTCEVQNRTQDFIHSKKMLYYWVISLKSLLSFFFFFN